MSDSEPSSFDSDFEANGDNELSEGPLPPTTGMTIKVRKHDVADDEPYSIFTHREKLFIVNITSFAALLSPLTAGIYFPLVHVISNEFHKGVELINLTVTMYIVMQGITPMFWGTLSDRLGRRPIMIACLATLACSSVGVALVPTSAYWLLMLFRCLQAVGSSSTAAVGAGIIADIATPAEIGGFIGIFALGPLVGLTLGPVIGGAVAQRFGWRAVFWFLCMSSTIWGFGLLLFLPETLPTIVGDKDISASWIYRPTIPIIGRNRNMKESTNRRPSQKPFTNPLRMFAYPDVFFLLLINAICYAIMYGVVASLSISFKKIYSGLSPRDLGLCFLPLGGGMLIGSLISGKLMDVCYRRTRDNLIHQAQSTLGHDPNPKAMEMDPSFPIEKARLQFLPYMMFTYTACVIAYGWSLQSRITIVVPLILQFIAGITVVTIMNAVQTLLVDLVPGQGSSITACNNITRCSMGAVMVSIIHPILIALGEGWTFTLLGGLCILASPLLYIEIWWGPNWRARRN